MGSLIAIFMVLTFRCEKTCSSVPVGALEDKVKDRALVEKWGLVRSNSLKCYGYTTSEWILQSDSITKASWLSGVYTYSLDSGFKWEPSLSSVSACSRLHYSEEGRLQWATMAQAMLALSNATLGKAAAWPQQPQPSVAAALQYNKLLAAHTQLLNWTWGYDNRGTITSQCADYVLNATRSTPYSPYMTSIVSSQGWVMLQVRKGGGT